MKFQNTDLTAKPYVNFVMTILSCVLEEDHVQQISY